MFDKLLCFRIAAFSLIGYCLAVAGPTYLDPRLSTHIGYGARIHKRPWIWWFFAPLAFFIPYIGLNFSMSKTSLILIAVLPFVLLVSILSLCFPPERPHSAVMFPAVAFTVVILLTVAFRIAADDFSYVANTAIPFESRLEAVKANVTFWQMISVYGAAGYLAFVVTWVYAMWFTTDKRVTSAKDRYTLGQAQVAFAIVVSICVVAGPLVEAFSNSCKAMSELSGVMK